MLKRSGRIGLVALTLLAGDLGGSAWARVDPLDLRAHPLPALFGSAFQHDPAAALFDT